MWFILGFKGMGPVGVEKYTDKSDRDVALKNFKFTKWDKASKKIRICKISDKCYKKRIDQMFSESGYITGDWGFF